MVLNPDMVTEECPDIITRWEACHTDNPPWAWERHQDTGCRMVNSDNHLNQDMAEWAATEECRWVVQEGTVYHLDSAKITHGKVRNYQPKLICSYLEGILSTL